jgi:transcriptional pleiotropic regulator of transition state genes
MKSTGITRKIDELGRIVLPIELRRTINISDRDTLEIYVENDRIILKKYGQTCTFCGENTSLLKFKNKCVCPRCTSELKNLGRMA